MDHYVELTINQNRDKRKTVMSSLMMQLHMVLIDAKKNGLIQIGVDFPEYSIQKTQIPSKPNQKDVKTRTKSIIGSKVRVFSTKENLEKLNLFGIFRNTTDVNLKNKIYISHIEKVPSDVLTYALLTRGRPNTNCYKKRMINRCKTPERAEVLRANMRVSGLNIPKFKMVSSSSNSETFEMYIKRSIVHFVEQKEGFDFNSYGLSNTINKAYVPVF